MSNNKSGKSSLFLGTYFSRGYRGVELIDDLKKKKVRVWAPALSVLGEVDISSSKTRFDLAVIGGKDYREFDRTISTARAISKNECLASITPAEVAIHLAWGLRIEDIKERGLSRLIVLHEPFKPVVARGEWLFSVEIGMVNWKDGPREESVCLTIVSAGSFSGTLATDYGFVSVMPLGSPKEKIPIITRLRDIFSLPRVLSPAY